MNLFLNPISQALKKHVFNLVGGEKFSAYDQIIDRIGPILTTQKDYMDIGNLFKELYEAGYLRAVEDHRIELEKMGVKVNVVKDIPKNPIFSQKNQTVDQ